MNLKSDKEAVGNPNSNSLLSFSICASYRAKPSVHILYGPNKLLLDPS